MLILCTINYNQEIDSEHEAEKSILEKATGVARRRYECLTTYLPYIKSNMTDSTRTNTGFIRKFKLSPSE